MLRRDLSALALSRGCWRPIICHAYSEHSRLHRALTFSVRALLFHNPLVLGVYLLLARADFRKAGLPPCKVYHTNFSRLQPNKHYLHRLLVIFLTFAPTFVILTISYEGLFYFAYFVTLLTWVRLEHYSQKFSTAPPPSDKEEASGNGTAAPTASLISQFRPLKLSDARVALFFFVLLQSAFFSTGNVASVSSFSLESVCRLVPVFDPFSQGALLVLKIMIPFALISANLGILNKRLGVAPSALFMVAMALSDVLTLHFFWVVKDEGSWLEIGSTISHFAIASMLCVFVAALEGVSAMFISGIEVENETSKTTAKRLEKGGMVLGSAVEMPGRAHGVVCRRDVVPRLTSQG